VEFFFSSENIKSMRLPLNRWEKSVLCLCTSVCVDLCETEGIFDREFWDEYRNRCKMQGIKIAALKALLLYHKVDSASVEKYLLQCKLKSGKFVMVYPQTESGELGTILIETVGKSFVTDLCRTNATFVAVIAPDACLSRNVIVVEKRFLFVLMKRIGRHFMNTRQWMSEKC
jgi:hypothetical protein